MKFFRILLLNICMVLFAYGAWEFVASIIDKSVDFTPLIVSLAALVVGMLIFVCEAKTKNKKKENNSRKPPLTKEKFEKKLSGILTLGKVLLFLIFASITVFVFSIVLLVLNGDFYGGLGIAMIVSTLFLLLCFTPLYFGLCVPARKSLKIVQRAGFSPEDCLSEIGSGAMTPLSRIVCTSRTLIFEKERLILPYSAIRWIYQTKNYVNGILARSFWNIYTSDGGHFAVAMDEADVLFIMSNHREKFHSSLVVGFTPEQKKAYAELKKAEKSNVENQKSREEQSAARKKAFLTVAAVAALLALMVVVASFLTKAVEFSQDLKPNSKCYIDAVEVEPLAMEGYDDTLYCRCTLASGEALWMEISKYDYEKLFDPQAATYLTQEIFRGVKYAVPVRLTGKTIERTEALAEISEDSKMFEFFEADAEQTQASGAEYKYVGVEYSDSVEQNWFVYADIIRIEAEKQRFLGSFTEAVTCNCTLASGEKVIIEMSDSDYEACFDASAEFYFEYEWSSFAYADPINFVTPVRVFGLVQYSGTIEFTYADKQEAEEAKIENQPPVEYSDSVLEGQKVYATLVSINPIYSSTDIRYPTVVDYICRGICSDGKTVWICISPSDYREYFSIDEEAIVLDHVVLYGTVVSTSHIIGAEEELNSKWLIEFDRIEANLL